MGAISDSAPDLYLRADSLALSDGAAVGTWTDSSGNGYDATQATAGAKPTFKTGIITASGKPVVRFDGGDYLASSAPTDANGQTVIAIARPTSFTGSPTIRGANGSGGFQCRYNATGSKLQMVKQSVADMGSSTSASSTSNFEVVAYRWTDGGHYDALASSAFSTGTPSDTWAYNAVNGSSSTVWLAAAAPSGGTPQWLRVRPRSLNYVATSVKIYSRASRTGYQAKDFTIQGSNDGTSWTTLDTRTGISWASAETKTFSFSNSTAYKFYRINCTATQSGNELEIAEIELNSDSFGSAQGAFYRNGSADGTVTPSSIPPFTVGSTTNVGRNGAGANEFLNGDIAVLLSWSRELSSTEITDITNELTAEWLQGPTASVPNASAVTAEVATRDASVTNAAAVGSAPVGDASVPNAANVAASRAVSEAGITNPATVGSVAYPVGAVINPATVVTDPVTVFTGAVTNPAMVSGDWTREGAVTNPAGVVADVINIYSAEVPNTPGVGAVPIFDASVPNPATVLGDWFPPVTGDASFEFSGHGDDPIVTEFVDGGAGSFEFSGHGDTPGDGEYLTGASSFTSHGAGRAQFTVTVNPATKRPDYRLILVEPDGTHRKQLVDAVMDDREWVLGGRGGFSFTLPRTSPNASLVRQYDEVQIWVGAEMLPEAWFIIVDPVKDAGPNLQFQCSGLRWLLENARIGKERPDILKNGGFEDNLKYWAPVWYTGSAAQVSPTTSIVTGANALDGGKALQVEAVESVIVVEHETAAIFYGNRPYAWDSPQSDGYLPGGETIVLGLVANFASDAVITIEGFTADVDGGDGLELSQRRADLAKATILAEHPDMTITAIGRGETIQVASNATPAGQAKNRRIVITGTSTRVGHRQAVVQWLTYMNPSTERRAIPLDLDGWINLINAVGPSKDGWGLYIDRRPAGGYADATIIDVAHTELDPDIFPLERWTLDGCSIDAPADGVTYLYNVRLYGTAGSTRFDAISLKPSLKTSFYNVHHSTAIGRLVEHAQDPAYGKVDLGIVNQCGAFGRIDDFEYWWKDHTVVDDAIDEILRADDAPDFWIATTPTQRIATTSPRRGSFTGMVFTYGENVASYTSTVAGDRVATTAFAVSNGTEGGGRAEAVYRTGALNGLVLERLETTGPNLYPARLRERAKAMTRYGRSDVITSLTLKSSATAGLVGVLVPGDTITCQVDDGGLDADGNYRIVGITHSFARNQLTLDLVPEV